jgi:phosphoribosylglycinamide formyltransferase-1
VHVVTDGLDEGPVVAQSAVPVLAGDTPETLAARVLEIEGPLYAASLRFVASGDAKWVDGEVRFGGRPSSPVDHRGGDPC